VYEEQQKNQTTHHDDNYMKQIKIKMGPGYGGQSNLGKKDDSCCGS
jgi:hypothetical protein